MVKWNLTKATSVFSFVQNSECFCKPTEKIYNNRNKIMSSEELTSIEKNGNYWLSKSNTAYHIINPNATSLTI